MTIAAGTTESAAAAVAPPWDDDADPPQAASTPHSGTQCDTHPSRRIAGGLFTNRARPRTGSGSDDNQVPLDVARRDEQRVLAHEAVHFAPHPELAWEINPGLD